MDFMIELTVTVINLKPVARLAFKGILKKRKMLNCVGHDLKIDINILLFFSKCTKVNK